MNKNANRSEQLKQLFAEHPSVKTFHVTSDGQFFTQKNDADNHAATLEDKEVEEEKRPKAEVVVNIDKNSDAEALAKAAAKYKSVFGVEPAEGMSIEAMAAEVGDKEAGIKKALVAEYTELFQKAPNHLTGIEKLRTLIAEKKAESKGE